MLEDAIRAGDCLAMLVEHYHGIGRMQDAYEHLRDMESRSIALHPYVNAQILEEVFRAVGAEEGRNGPRAAKSMDNHGSEDGRSEEKQGSSSSSSDKAALLNKNSSHSHSSAADDGDIDSDIEEDIGDSPDPSSSASSSRRGGEFKPQSQHTGHRAGPSGTGNSKRAVEKDKDRGERSSGSKKRESARREDDEEQDALDEDIDEVTGWDGISPPSDRIISALAPPQLLTTQLRQFDD